jgi:hypothetical protein
VKPQFDDAMPFSEGLGAVRIGDEESGKYGFIDKKGNYVVNPQFDAVASVFFVDSVFSEDLAPGPHW